MITPDSKDWTWVVARKCPECGFDASAWALSDIPQLVRENAAEWVALHHQGVVTAGRPSPDRWSSLEYACHVRDVYRRFHQRIELMLNEDDPQFENWDQDQSAIDDRYDEQDPETVVGDLHAAALAMADLIEQVKPDQWERPGRRSNGSAFTVATICQYMVHDPIHHIWDVTPSAA